MPSSCYLEVRGYNSGTTGSGFLVSQEGHLITNHHVVESAERYDGSFRTEDITVGFQDGYEVGVREVVAVDEDHDLALLRIPPSRDPLPILGEGHAQLGSEVAIIGRPEGLSLSVNKGTVTSLFEDNPKYFRRLFQLDAAINPGNSGGPVLNKNGQVVGVVVSRYESGVFGREIQNMNRAIRVEHVRALLEENGVPYEQEPLIKDIFLQEMDSLSPQQRAELDALKEARIAKMKERQREEQRRKDKLMRERLRAQRELQQLNEQQKKTLAEEKFRLQQRLQEAEYERKIEAERDREERLRLQRREDRLEIKRAEQRERERRKRYYAQLPPRLMVSLGGAATYFAGPIAESPNITTERLRGMAELGLYYRLDLRERPKSSYHRGTALGIAGQAGRRAAEVSSVGAAWSYGLEGRLLLREWFLVGAGYEWSVGDAATAAYPVGRLGVVGRLGPLDAFLRGAANFAELSEPLWRLEAGLAVRFGFGKW